MKYLLFALLLCAGCSDITYEGHLMLVTDKRTYTSVNRDNHDKYIYTIDGQDNDGHSTELEIYSDQQLNVGDTVRFCK
jgi:hypothetical protein